MNKQDLLNGKKFIFDNENWCIENESDQQKQAEVSFNKHLGRFIIWFNSSIVADPKTFKSLENQLNQLKDNYNLDIVQDEEPFAYGLPHQTGIFKH